MGVSSGRSLVRGMARIAATLQAEHKVVVSSGRSLVVVGGGGGGGGGMARIAGFLLGRRNGMHK